VLFAALIMTASLAAHAGPAHDSTILGDWEVSRVLMTGGMQPQWSMREDDPRLLGRRLSIAADGMQFRNIETDCILRRLAGGKPQSMRSLFARPGNKRPPGMHGTLYGRQEDYELGGLRGQAVKLFEVHCRTGSESFLDDANWLATTTSPATLLMPYQPDALLVLRRLPAPGSRPDAAQTEYCRQAGSPSDQAICADRQLWRMHSYTISAQARAQSPRPELNAELAREIADQLQKRQACNGERNCLYEVLDRHIELLVQRW
jgi:hypothetical protein